MFCRLTGAITMTRHVAIFLTLCAMAIPHAASATGGVWCDAQDANLSFHYDSSSSRDGTGGWWGIKGHVESRIPGLPADLAKFEIKDENVTQRWLDRNDVRLELQKVGTEKQNFASVRLTITAIALEEADYKGPYELDIRMPDGTAVTKGGYVACSAD
jgi:hypothetical protein